MSGDDLERDLDLDDSLKAIVQTILGKGKWATGFINAPGRPPANIRINEVRQRGEGQWGWLVEIHDSSYQIFVCQMNSAWVERPNGSDAPICRSWWRLSPCGYDYLSGAILGVTDWIYASHPADA